MKPLLVQCALGAIKDKDSYFGIKYTRIKKRRGHKKAIIAIARMMLVSIYHMILTGEVFKPSDYEKYTRIKKRRGHKKAIIAIARMMLVSIYHMILTGEVFKPSDYETFKNPHPSVKQQELTEKSAIEFLKKSGFDVSKLTIL